MKILRSIALLSLAGGAFARTLGLAPRATNAPDGDAFAWKISGLDLAQRDQAIAGEILHTVQVKRNGFIEALLSGTPDEGNGYEYLGPGAYTNWIQNGD